MDFSKKILRELRYRAAVMKTKHKRDLEHKTAKTRLEENNPIYSELKTALCAEYKEHAHEYYANHKYPFRSFIDDDNNLHLFPARPKRDPAKRMFFNLDKV